MIARVLSIAGPVSIYITIAIVVMGLWRERRKFEWVSLIPALAGILLSFAFLEPIHRLFFDEDMYINIASNLSHAPVAQLTLLGSPTEVGVSTYYKEPSGWPVLLSLVFIVAGLSEPVAFIVARILYGLAILAVYHLARELVEARYQALAASMLFAATPAAFWFSPSPGTDIPAALFVVLGLWGVVAGNGALAAAGLAMAAQTRMELMALMPIIWLFDGGKISRKWKAVSVALAATELVHVVWVLSVSPVLAEAEKVPSAFALDYVPRNVAATVAYLLNPAAFPAAVTLMAAIALAVRWRASRARPWLLLYAIGVLFVVYALFYAGSFRLNQRYSIQILAPLTILAVSLFKRPVYLAALGVTLIIPYVQPLQFTGYLEALAGDHRAAVLFAPRIGPDDLIVSATPQMFMNNHARAMDAVFASARKEKLEEELRSRTKIWYHAGVRTNVSDSAEAEADRWMKSNFELHLIDSRELSGFRIAFYEVLLKPLDREARQRAALDGKRHRGKLS